MVSSGQVYSQVHQIVLTLYLTTDHQIALTLYLTTRLHWHCIWPLTARLHWHCIWPLTTRLYWHCIWPLTTRLHWHCIRHWPPDCIAVCEALATGLDLPCIAACAMSTRLYLSCNTVYVRHWWQHLFAVYSSEREALTSVFSQRSTKHWFVLWCTAFCCKTLTTGLYNWVLQSERITHYIIVLFVF